MKKILISFYCITLSSICQALAPSTSVFAANVNDFYFDSFTADYYLEKDSAGISHLKVVEEVVAVFPDYEQNKGIVRQIPFTNQAGKNITLPSLTEDNLTLLRNGEKEPIWSIEKYEDYYLVSTGTDDYLLGPQTYTFSYEFEKVITDFESFQELYWDTNGTGSYQRFNSLSATIHFSDEEMFNNFTGETSCYVGYYGESGQSRCFVNIDLDEKTVTFSTSDLKAGENLTFVLEFKKDSFAVPEPEKSYLVAYYLIAFLVLVFIFIPKAIKYSNQFNSLKNLYKNTPVVPQYTPIKDLSVAEMSELAIDSRIRGSDKVATLIDLAVNHKIKLKKGEKKIFGGFNWLIEVVSVDNLKTHETIVLELLNNGHSVSNGATIEVKNHSYSSRLETLSHTYSYTLTKSLKTKNLHSEPKTGKHVLSIFASFALPFFLFWIFTIAYSEESEHKIILLENLFPLISLLTFVLPVVSLIISERNHKYATHTEQSIAYARYLDGLAYYIKLAEADRLKFLQSVQNVDTSPQGIVSLYEKLLPYAILLGLENSWMNELNKYYTMPEVTNPTWFYGQTFLISDFHNLEVHTRSSINSGTYEPSSSSSSSSSSSGGGGGGFSGGGGGGGGFGGR